MEPFTLVDVNRIEPVTTRKIKFTLFLILVVSVTALVLVILVITGQINPKWFCREGMCLTELGASCDFLK